MSGTTFDSASRVQVALTASGQPGIAVLVPGIQGPSGTAFEEIALNKLAPGALPVGITVASANIVNGTIVNADINAAAGIVDTKLATISTAGKVANSATTATADNTASAIVARDASGNFAANVITADLAGKSDSTDQLENGLTFDGSGSGVASGTEFDGVAALTVSYNSVGAASSGHSHANLIFVPAGANDTALAAAFADAVANDKKIIFSEDTTVKIPTVAATIQVVCDRVVPTVRVEILIEAGHQITTRSVINGGDFSRFRISSVDPEVLVGAALPADQATVECIHAVAPEWNFLLDCNGNVDNGLRLIASRGWIRSGKGVKRSRRANVFVHFASNLASEVVNGIGAVLSDGQGHGAWITWGSSAQLSFSDARNNGSVRTEDFAFFVSRGVHLMMDRANMSGSANGVRNARSIVDGRDCIFDDIPGWSVIQFELGYVSCSRGSFLRCGSAGKPILQVGIGSSGRNQSGGEINAEDSTFTDAKGDIAVVNGGNGYINLDNASGTGIERKVAIASWGTVTFCNASCSAGAVNQQTELVLVSRGGKFHGFGSPLDGGGVVRNPARAIADGYIALDTCPCTNFTENVICRLSDAGTCYPRSSTINGITDVMQRGANANGEFVRFNNGTQECWAWLEVTEIVDPKLMLRSWTFPAPFVGPLETIAVNGTLSRRNPNNESVVPTREKLKDCQLVRDTAATTLASFRVELNSTTTQTFVTGNTVWIQAHAIGRWF